jgi:Tfp pilus assembly protein PilO
LEGILAVVFIFGGGSAFLLAISPVGRAIADRIRYGATGSDEVLRRLQETQQAILEELDSLRQAVAELEERMDFAERLLTRQREAGRLVPGGEGSGAGAG